jgi:hypothetical protein
MGWDTNIFRPQTGSKTSYGRRMNRNESAVEVELERESVNGVLVLKMSDL